jgi:hypothetical protein
MNKIKILFLLGILVIVSIVVHASYQKLTSYECVSELPPEPFTNSETGQKYYVGQQDSTIKTRCTGGILSNFPLN